MVSFNLRSQDSVTALTNTFAIDDFTVFLGFIVPEFR